MKNPAIAATREPHVPDQIKSALVALYSGVANEGQQKQALQWMLWEACDFYGLSFRIDGAGGDRSTAFNEGRRFVALQIMAILGLLNPYIK